MSVAVGGTFRRSKFKSSELVKIWRPRAVLIEDAASGQSLIQTLQLNSGLPILAVKPQGDKQSRASAASPLVESGRVYIPAESSWGREFIDEVTAFPAPPHDDQVDSFCQGLAWMREGWNSFDSEAFRESYEAQRRVFGRRPRGWDAPNSMFQPIGAPQHTSIGQNGQSGAPLHGSCEQYDRAEDAAGEPTSWAMCDRSAAGAIGGLREAARGEMNIESSGSSGLSLERVIHFGFACD